MWKDAKYGEVTVENPPASMNLPEQDSYDTDVAPEPVFILRAQDTFSVPMLARYKNFAIQADLPSSFIEAIDGLTAEFSAWQSSHADRVKVPDDSAAAA